MVLRHNIPQFQTLAILAILFLKITSINAIRNGSLSFVIDETGSMYREIQKVKEATTLIHKAITQNSSQIQEVVLVTFNDPEFFRYATNFRLRDATKSEQKLKTALNQIVVAGGGNDCKEYCLSGIQTALENSLQNSFLFVFTDVAPKDTFLKDKVIKHAQAMASQTFFFLTVNGAGCHSMPYELRPYYEIAKATNGQVFQLDSTAELKELLKFLKFVVSGEGDVSKLIDIEPNQNAKIPFTVDDQTEYVIVSASGDDVELKMTITPSNKYEYEHVAWHRNVKILKLNNPLPGSYEVSVKGSSRTSVMIFGRTDFTFQHGFSETVPPTFRNDKKQPTEGTKHYLLINVTDPSHSVRIETAEILSMDEKVIISLPLMHESKDYYRTEIFMPPNDMFKIRIKGEGKITRKSITRTAKTPIKPRLRDLDPEIKIEGGGTFRLNSKVTLKCKVRANPKPTILWKNEIENVFPGTTTVAESNYDYVSTLTVTATKSSAYYCYAENNLGENSERVDIIVESPFFVEGKSNETIDAEYGKPLVLSCNIKSSYPMKINWYYGENKREIIKDSNVWRVMDEGKQLRINQVGTNEETQYFCVASILGNTDITHTLERDVKITHHAPVMDNSEVLHVKENESVTVKCNILKAYPKPKIQWQLKKHGDDVFQTITTTPEVQDTYTIKSVELGHTGIYRCIAENHKGSHHRDTKLFVETKPKVNVFKDGKEVNKIEVDYAAIISLACRVISQPVPRIYWTYSNHSTIASDVIVKNFEYTVYLKTFEPMMRSETFTCFATNSLGEASKSVAVEVKSPFEFVPTDENVGAKYGEETKLKCGVKTKVPAKVIWTFKGKSIMDSEKYLVSDDRKELKIKAIDIDLQGEYACATIIIGDKTLLTNRKFQVRIIDAESPVLEKRTSFVKVPRKGNLTLKCNIIKGNPKPKITWQVINNPMKSVIVESENLQINNAVDQDAGLYKCLAKNVIGMDEHTIELAVQGPPIILSDENKVYRAVVGDPTLRIPCEVVGHPKPRISWSTEQGIVLAGERFEIEENAIVIINPKTEDSKNYTCYATNEFGSAQKAFEGFVTTYFPEEELGDSIYIDLKRGATKDLNCSEGSLKGRWFKELVPTNTTGTLTLSKVEDKDSGNYTCRISDKFGSESHTKIVLVGYGPSFDVPNYVEEWTGRKINLSCQTDMQPSQRTAKVEWFYNGKPSDKMTGPPSNSEHPIIGWGTYICKVTNTHGTATKTFKILSKDCLLHLAPDVKNSPLVLDPTTGKWPQVKLDGNYWNVKSDQSLLLSCHHGMNSNTFQKLPGKHEVVAICDHEDIFTVEGKKYKFSDLQCQSDVLPSVEHTGKKCVSDTSEEINVGYHIDHSGDFLQVYSVCYDLDNHVPVYSHVVLSPPVNVVPVFESWHKYQTFGEKSSKNCDGESKCCLGLTQLTNQLEVKHGAPQIATFIEGLNSVPFWHHCHNSTITWNELEKELISQKRGFVWSGAHAWSRPNGASVPRYLWKMFKKTSKSRKPTAVVRVNAQDPTDADILCNTPCNKKFAEIIQDKFTYCCDSAEFKRVFNLVF